MENATPSKKDLEGIRDLFGLAHDLIAQATFPGHVSGKVQDAMKFLAYQYNDFKVRAEALAVVVADPNGTAIPVVAEAPAAPAQA